MTGLVLQQQHSSIILWAFKPLSNFQQVLVQKLYFREGGGKSASAPNRDVLCRGCLHHNLCIHSLLGKTEGCL